MALDVASQSSSSLLANDCMPLASPPQSSCTASDDALWSDVDLAESYLISSQFDEAAALCTAVLRKLKVLLESTESDRHDGIDDNEIENMVEAAGMVLIQAYSESGRVSLIFKDMETIFGCTAKVPSSVFLAGLCLQISAELYSEAQLSVESFLKRWSYTTSNQHVCIFKPSSRYDRKYFCLSPERYMQIVDIYSVQVLTKGLGRINHALQWIRETDIPAERKQDIIGKLNKLALCPEGKEERVLVGCSDKMTRSTLECGKFLSKSQVLGSVEIEGDARVSKQAIKEFDSHSSLKSIFLLSPVMDLLSNWMIRSSLAHSDGVSRWKAVPAVVNQNKLSFGGAIAVFLMIAVYRQRHSLSRLFGGLGKALRHVLHAVFISLHDFWQLAFNVQLNPLAAVQPLPSTHYRR